MTEAPMVLAERRGRAGLLTLNRPQARNALSDRLMEELGAALLAFDADPDVGALVLTGGPDRFAAGADIREMAPRRYPMEDFIGRRWETVTRIRKPVIAAVAGPALGGGCELAMMCDIVIAADTARFGQPEIGLGVIPGAGGTQRLARAVGKAVAMDMVLTGRQLDAAEAERLGLVARVVPAERLLAEALAIAERIALLPPDAVAIAKDAVNRSFETTLAEGLRYERALFLSLFGTAGQREGMAAFLDKRPPRFR